MLCKAATLLTTTWSIAVTVDALEGLSLLQTHAHLHTQTAQPDPKAKSQSSMSGKVDIATGEVDFECLDGLGKWVYMNTRYNDKGLVPTEDKLKTDLSVNTTNIVDFYTFQGAIRSRHNVKDDQSVDITYTTHRRLKNEKDCFDRAKQDYWCNHFAEDVVYGGTGWKSPPIMGVWYGGSGFGEGIGMDAVKEGVGSSTTCMCGPVDVKGIFPFKGQAAEVEVGNTNEPGMWFCKFGNKKEELITEAQLADLQEEQASNPVKEPREKKTKEEREQCKKAKADAKASRAALKALRAQLKEQRAAMKALRAQIKAAKEDLAAKKGSAKEIC